MTPDSIHIIAEFSKCPKAPLLEASMGEAILKRVVDGSGLTSVGIRSYQFKPCGYTAAALLTESHITLHTWPEYDSVQIDIFTCGSRSSAKKAYELLKAEFKPKSFTDKIFLRTLDNITTI